MNFYRIPLNAFVVVVLLKVKFMSPTAVFSICAAAHIMALAGFLSFRRAIAGRPAPMGMTAEP